MNKKFAKKVADQLNKKIENIPEGFTKLGIENIQMLDRWLFDLYTNWAIAMHGIPNELASELEPMEQELIKLKFKFNVAVDKYNIGRPGSGS